ncbi:MAG: fumarylacetoacetate hydrolase family protein [Rhodoferax sp.]|nr:fumarylacetoacetate hydrolase family protein [Rhodoferax sp.]
MKFIRFASDKGPTLGVRQGEEIVDLGIAARGSKLDLATLLAAGQDGLSWVESLIRHASTKAVHHFAEIRPLVPFARPEKIICVGLNYANHIKEAPTPQEVPKYPVIFLRQARTLIAHREALRRPHCSDQFDFEGELACIIGRPAKNVTRETALHYVGGYALFNEASVRDFQFKSHQWTMGKNFDATGAFGPELITADELPPGARDLTLSTVLNGETVQSASTNDMIFDIATLISELSVAMTLLPGDVIVTGTPSGVGIGRTPPLWMKHGDTCTVRVDGFEPLVNPVLDGENTSASSTSSENIRKGTAP